VTDQDIRKPLKKFLPHLLEAKSGQLREAETVQRIERFFEHVLGYDGMTDISREAQIKGKYCDLALKIDGSIAFLVEAKACCEPLRERHIEQAQHYASKGNIRWVVLTNGLDWRLYHLTFEEGIDCEVAFEVNLEKEEEIDAACAKLALLHKLAIKKGELEEYWKEKTALGPASIALGLFHEEALKVVRRLIRKKEGFLVDPEDLGRSIHEMLSTEARELIGPFRLRRKRKASPKSQGDGAGKESCDGDDDDDEGDDSDDGEPAKGGRS